jgi:hypothetical protein
MMRMFLLALSVILPPLVAAPASAQDSAVSIAGWERQVASTGTVYYRCRAASCTVQSTVSYRTQPPGRMPSVAEFRQGQERVNQRMVESSNGRLSRVDMIDVAESERVGAKLVTAVKLLVPANGPNQYLATALVVDGPRRFSIVSTAPNEAAARANLTTFVPVVMLQVQLQPQGTPPARNP